MEGSETQLEEHLLTQELNHLITSNNKTQPYHQNQTSIFYAHTLPVYNPDADPNRHRFNHYADKQLQHLVVAEQFHFERISATLNYIFREERMRFTETSCRERWDQLHVLRLRGKAVGEKRMEDKRATSVSAFSDPFSLYNLEEMVDKLHQTEVSTEKPEGPGVSPPEYKGYNIFKNSIRKIDDLQEYKKREQQMLLALQSAQSKTITDKLMHFQPYYERLEEFQVHEEELTEEKMKEIMSNPIEIDRLEGQLKIKDMNQSNESWKGKRSRREEGALEARQHRYDIEDDWDQYESD